ncbi:glutathione S-transferase family protein [Glaciecola siphonariae]|uniref:Glutathione S-transferase family protein n=1 Tax=Glaciecola siphonariae TaxID=521012 RepID=A0ABV9LY88_9ALTE
MQEKYTHFGVEVSLFSGKTRAYLRYKHIPFVEVTPSAKVINKELYPQTGMRMIPVVKTPEGEYLQDTTDIIDKLEQRFPSHSVYPEQPLQKFLAYLLELYADEWLLLPAMHYRWHYKRDHLWFIMKEFGNCMMPSIPRIFRPFAACLPALYFGRLYKPVLGVSKQNYRQVEAFYLRFLESFNKHLDSIPFVLGTRPSIADFGFMGPLYAHLYRDPYSGKVMKTHAPNVARWVERMNQLDTYDFGEDTGFERGAQVAEHLVPILSQLQNDYYPILQETSERIAKRVKQKPNERLPRFLGKMTFTLEGVEETRYVNTYAQWMWQRAINYFYGLSEAEQQIIREALEAKGLSKLVAAPIKEQIERRQNKLYPVNAK